MMNASDLKSGQFAEVRITTPTSDGLYVLKKTWEVPALDVRVRDGIAEIRPNAGDRVTMVDEATKKRYSVPADCVVEPISE